MLNGFFAVSVVNICGRLLNFILFFVVANLFGVSVSTDWFFFVYGVAYFFVSISYYAAESAFVPEWYRLAEDERADFYRFSVKLSFCIVIIACSAMLVGGFWVAPWRRIHVPDIGMAAVWSVLVLSLQPGLAFLSSLFSSYHQYQRRYILPTIHISLRSIGVLATLLLLPQRNILVLSVAFLVGEILRFICLFPRDLKISLKSVLRRNSDKVFWDVYRNVLWMTLVLACTVVNPIVDLAMVGSFSPGSVTLVEYAGKLRGMPVLALVGVLVILLGEWAQQHNSPSVDFSWKTVARACWLTTLFCLPFVLILMLTLNIWVPIVFRPGNFNASNLQEIERLLWWYLMGIPFLALSHVLSRAILVLRQVRLLALVSLLAMGVNFLANIFLLKYWGLIGVAIATSVVDVFVFLCYFLFVRRYMSDVLTS
ncbi:MAG TPA: hypothetical protein ENN66_04610 [Proteobacteria bacterium]|nr:hypothetical protein [Pseudomonadota bacterium]